jgi:hypothetical protein
VLHYNAASIRKATLAEQPRNTFDDDLAVNIGGASSRPRPSLRRWKNGSRVPSY